MPGKWRHTKTSTAVAKHFGVSTATVGHWARDLEAPFGINPKNGRRLYSINELQEWLVTNGMRDPGCRLRTTRGRPTHATKAAGAALAAAGMAGTTEPPPGVNPSLLARSERSADAALREKEAKAQLAELTLAQKQGEVISREEVELRIEQAIESVKVALLGMPRKYTDFLAQREPADLRERLDQVVREVLGLFVSEVGGEAPERPMEAL